MKVFATLKLWLGYVIFRGTRKLYCLYELSPKHIGTDRSLKMNFATEMSLLGPPANL